MKFADRKHRSKTMRTPPGVGLTVVVLFVVIWFVPILRHGDINFSAIGIGFGMLGSALLYWESTRRSDSLLPYVLDMASSPTLSVLEISWWSGCQWVATIMVVFGFIVASMTHKGVISTGSIILGLLVPLTPVLFSLLIMSICKLNGWAARTQQYISLELEKANKATDETVAKSHRKEAARMARNVIKQAGFICLFVSGLLQLPSALFG